MIATLDANANERSGPTNGISSIQLAQHCTQPVCGDWKLAEDVIHISGAFIGVRRPNNQTCRTGDAYAHRVVSIALIGTRRYLLEKLARAQSGHRSGALCAE